jgi:ribosome-binding protein aMBF1 (putative translation factor)
MPNRPQNIVRDRRLTPAEVERFRAIRQQVDLEKPEIAERLRSGAGGPKCWDDLYELRALIESLRHERERRGLSREEVAAHAELEERQIAELEEHHELNPSISVLSRFAAAVGRHLLLELSTSESAEGGPL